MNKKGTIHFKGQLKLYMQWPVVMTILLIAMNIWIYMVDQSAGFLMSIFVIIYAIIAFHSVCEQPLPDFCGAGGVCDAVQRCAGYPAAGIGHTIRDSDGRWKDTLG